MTDDKNAIYPDWIDFDKLLDTQDLELREFLAGHQRELTTLHRAVARSHCYFDTTSVREDIEIERSKLIEDINKLRDEYLEVTMYKEV